MSKGRLTVYLVAMALIGAAFFSALGALVNWRMGTPLATAALGSNPGTTPSDPLSALQQGLRESLTIAWQELVQNDRTEAVRALDAAQRAAEVGRYAADGPLGRLFQLLYRQVEQARASLQDGQARRAEQILAAATAIALGPREQLGPSRSAPLPNDLTAYRGAHVLDEHGVRIGEIKQAENGVIMIEVGGNNDVLGFIDLGGGRRIQVPANRLVFGERKALGSTMVVLPDLSTPMPALQGHPMVRPIQLFADGLGPVENEPLDLVHGRLRPLRDTIARSRHPAVAHP